MIRTYHVLLLRDTALLGEDEFKTVQDLQYIAGPISAKDEATAAVLAVKGLRSDDRGDGIDSGEITVLGHIEGGIYRPWLNGKYR